jgi:hypothetical protein
VKRRSNRVFIVLAGIMIVVFIGGLALVLVLALQT